MKVLKGLRLVLYAAVLLAFGLCPMGIRHVFAEVSDEAYMQVLEQGKEEIALGHEQKAIDLYSSLLAKYPEEEEIRSYRGAAYFSLGDLDHAIEDFSQVLDTSPDSMQANYYVGLIFLRWGDMEKAESYLNKALALCKTDSEKSLVLDVMGQAACYRKDYQNAVKIFTEAISAEESYVPYFHRAQAYQKLDDIISAGQDYFTLIEKYPFEAEPYHQRGLCRGMRGVYELALEDFSKAIELAPQIAEYYNDRGYTHACQKNYAAAIDDYTKAVEINPKYQLAYMNRAAAYEKTGKKKEARIDRDIVEQLMEFETE